MSNPPPINPYAPPSLDATQVAAGEDRSTGLPLFSPTAVSVATFFGSIAAGVVIMAINYSRSGQPSACRWMLAWGTLATIALFGIIFVLPDEVPSVVILVAQVATAHALATKLQRPLIDQHLARGGQLASAWWAFGISLLVGVAVFAALCAVLLLAEMVLPPEWLPSE
jgi:hypothetical protein